MLGAQHFPNVAPQLLYWLLTDLETEWKECKQTYLNFDIAANLCLLSQPQQKLGAASAAAQAATAITYDTLMECSTGDSYYACVPLHILTSWPLPAFFTAHSSHSHRVSLNCST